MFKKENLTTTIFGLVILFFVGVIVVSSIFEKKEEPMPTINLNQQAEGTFSINEQPIIGDKNAKNEILVFSDYNCPHCKNWEQTVLPLVVKDLVDSGDAYLAHVNFPVLGESSVYAGAISEIVTKENPSEFWNFHHEMYEGLATIDRTVEVAAKYLPNLSEEEIRTRMTSKEIVNQVLLDKTQFEKYQLKGTPAIVVNGKLLENPTFEDIKKEIEKNGGK